MFIASYFIKQKNNLDYDVNVQVNGKYKWIERLFNIVFELLQSLCLGFFISRCCLKTNNFCTSFIMFLFLFLSLFKTYGENILKKKNSLFSKFYNFFMRFSYVIFITDHFIFLWKFVIQKKYALEIINTNYLFVCFIGLSIFYNIFFLLMILIFTFLLYINKKKVSIFERSLEFKIVSTVISILQCILNSLFIFYSFKLFVFLEIFAIFVITNFILGIKNAVKYKRIPKTPIYHEILKNYFVIFVLQKIYFEFYGIVTESQDEFFNCIFQKN